jgi:hypothetical protein
MNMETAEIDQGPRMLPVVKVIERTGDADWLTHGGGAVVETEHGVQWWWWKGVVQMHPADYYDRDEADVRFTVHRVDIDDDVTDTLPWVDWIAIAAYSGVQAWRLATGTIRARQQLLEAVSGYYGAERIDPNPVKALGCHLEYSLNDIPVTLGTDGGGEETT